MVYKGIITSIKENKAKVAPVDDMEAVSRYITIPTVSFIKCVYSGLPHEQTMTVQKGDTVAYALFNDGSGVILAKM